MVGWLAGIASILQKNCLNNSQGEMFGDLLYSGTSPEKLAI